MKKQNGMSMIGFLIVAILAAFAIITAMKVIPAYIEYHGVKQAMEATVDDDSGHESIYDLHTKLSKRLDMNYVTSVKASDIKIVPLGSHFSLAVDYTSEQPVVGNIFILLKFHYETTHTPPADD